jgi:hypothetical protein
MAGLSALQTGHAGVSGPLGTLGSTCVFWTLCLRAFGEGPRCQAWLSGVSGTHQAGTVPVAASHRRSLTLQLPAILESSHSASESWLLSSAVFRGPLCLADHWNW